MKKGILLLMSLFLILTMPQAALADTWNGSDMDVSWYQATETAFSLDTAAELAGLAKLVNEGTDFSGKTITLGADINLSNCAWTPIGLSGKPFKGTFDGNGKTISNLYINTTADNVGLFGYSQSPAIFKNLTICNVNIKAGNFVGALVGNAFTGRGIQNVTVNGLIRMEGGYDLGGISGYGYASPVTGCSIKADDGSYLKVDSGNVGGIWGYRCEGDMQIDSCTVDNLDIYCSQNAGGIIGLIHYGNSVTNCTVSNTTITATNPNKQTVGLIAGSNYGTASQPTTILNNESSDDVVATSGSKVITAQSGIVNNANEPVTPEKSTVATHVKQEGGKYTQGIFQFINPDDIAEDVLAVSRDQDAIFVGQDAQTALENAPDNASYTLLSVPDGGVVSATPNGNNVQITNGTGQDVSINGSLIAENQKWIHVVQAVSAPAMPKTGDDSQLVLWAALLALSLFGLIGIRKASQV